MLEATYSDRARQQETHYQNIEMSCWRRAFEKDSRLAYGKYAADHPYPRKQVYWSTEEIRHAAEHRTNIAITNLKPGLSLPRLLGDRARENEINRVWDLVCDAADAKEENDESEDNLDKVLDEALTKFAEIDSVTKLYTQLQYKIEASIFQYTQCHHPDLLRERGWTQPEQGELPAWHEAYRPYYGTPAKQNLFSNDNGDLLSTCLDESRRLRNQAAHRDQPSDEEHIIGATHRTIRCLMVLGDHRAAIDVEILVEQFLTQSTRDQVLHRLRDAYRDGQQLSNDIRLPDLYCDTKVPPNEIPFATRREEQRRSVISEILSKVDLPEADLQDMTGTANPDRASMALDDEGPARCVAANCLPMLDGEVRCHIVLTSPDIWATRWETISPTMHPKLRVLPQPESRVVCEREWEPQNQDTDTQLGPSVSFDANGLPFITTPTAATVNISESAEKDGAISANLPIFRDDGPDESEED